MNLIDRVVYELPISDHEAAIGLYVTGVGRCNAPSGVDYPQFASQETQKWSWDKGRILTQFELHFIVSGQGEFESATMGKTDLGPDSILLLFPGVWHRFRPSDSTGWKEYWVAISGDLVHRIVSSSEFTPSDCISVLNRSSGRLLIDSFERLITRVQDDLTTHSAVLSANVLELLALALDAEKNEQLVFFSSNGLRTDRIEDPIVAKTIETIWTRSHRPIPIGQIVSEIPTTRRTLERRFIDVVGHSILEEIVNCRLIRAKKLLTETDLSIRSIAVLTGFVSQEKMRKAMLSREGVPPVEYRAKTRS
ncbi:AraC family transcriptional regulator [Bremerella sp. P1]|uniref:AraC family transcriptional regulator n=1 Tax=Bremerella sp. P1 TaxID=3026424 RepID=UPI0023680AF9|nr:helix-turn-helix domain-containing protein [Bremerella sp. P1]WDI41030.1 AraC family ligand binding domain-containing protein [Bremerella sp. P1]